MTAHRPNPLDPCEAHEYSDATRSAVQNRIADDAFRLALSDAIATGKEYAPRGIKSIDPSEARAIRQVRAAPMAFGASSLARL